MNDVLLRKKKFEQKQTGSSGWTWLAVGHAILNEWVEDKSRLSAYRFYCMVDSHHSERVSK